MARSFRHTPIFGYTTAASEKADKVAANRAIRRAVNTALATGDEDMPVIKRDYLAKDGKRFIANATPAMLRK